ncbi:MAG: hypothetical protein IT483_14665 [Gammaproteobacteria bacterium]|nr:hypothetical protein [Gammaproteobacteria bacterium]
MDQGTLRLEPGPDAPGQAAGSLFDDRLLLTLASANDAFLRLAGELHGAWPAEGALGIAAHHLASLAALGCHRRNALAGLPYVLFDLRFRDDGWWAALSGGAPSVNDGAESVRPDLRVVEFARYGLTLGWHLAQVSEASARIALGMGDAALAVLRGAPLGAVDGLAARAGTGLTARFAGSLPYWRLFIQAALAPDAGTNAGLRLLGLQLMGMDAARSRGVQRRSRRTAVP